MLGKILFCMPVGTGFGPKNIMVALAERVHQAGEPDEHEVGPAETLTVDSMPELMHTNLVSQDILFAFAPHPTTGPKVDKGTQRNTHTIFIVFFRHKGDTAQHIHTVGLAYQCTHKRIKPSNQRLRQLPSKPRKQLEDASHGRPFIVGQEEPARDLGNKAKPMRHRWGHRQL